jgi:hypothetical protein
MANSVAALAGVALDLGLAEQAARMLGASKSLQEAAGLPLQSLEQAQYDRDSDSAQAHLGSTAFASAFAAGQALTPEEAVAEALSAEVGVERRSSPEEACHPEAKTSVLPTGSRPDPAS